MAERTQVKSAKDSHKEEILQRPNVVGVGIGYKEVRGRQTEELVIKALVRQKVPVAGLPPQAIIPQRIDGVPTDVVAVGEIKAQQSRTERYRPAPGGVSIGHYQVTAGTFGCVVRDRASGTRLILSNNHVLANSNAANPGDAILQPGAVDGGQVNEDIIAYLERFYPIHFTTEPGNCSFAQAFAELGNAIAALIGSKHRLNTYQQEPGAYNLVDAAVAKPINDGDILDEILEIGEISGTAEAFLGMAVRKSGRTTGLTTGEINVLDSTVDVSYGVGQVARFENQLVAGPMSQGGDSGSLVVAADSQAAVGLLFAGSEQTTIFNPIQAVLDSLEVDIGPSNG